MDEVAGAIADPVRRDILVMLRQGPLTAGQIADRFEVSRPAVSRHLRVLRASGLVHDTPVGRQRLYELDPDRLHSAHHKRAEFMGDTEECLSVQKIDAADVVGKGDLDAGLGVELNR